ncbi:hypothetical protein GCM10007852_34140 [Agaribacter marinus]|uniref:Uncharacterized protein n=1 Tax=Agaribacter marinus TaxID=1431249 RepID=A0AA37T2U7_9ALTE|nr:hypothetical protein GCM10007852_34140 [Agaribacter marinus]
MAKQNQAYASYVQMYAAATNTMTHWRILSEPPEILRQNGSMTLIIKDKLKKYMGIWQYILSDLQTEKISW